MKPTAIFGIVVLVLSGAVSLWALRTSRSDAAPVVPTPVPAPSPPAPSTLEERIADQFGSECSLQGRCRSLLGIDCNSASDGPFYYVKADTLEIVARCGGYCMNGECSNCPPSEWTCGPF